ncbi:FAD:protein FMN transferase [Aureitalea marina]|uniref:FAD:protein FMN transferase n=1 Tax=Aureitalea marina TaxID=930804 RepID=UPI001FE331D7|nr:FAD:protein FMN transferase [Aureitalea marina]
MTVFVLWGCSQPTPSLYTLKGEAFGTTYAIQYYSLEPTVSMTGVDSVIQMVNNSVSTYIPDSDISRINAGDSTVVADQIFAEVFQLSEQVFKESNGYFDPTIGVLRNAYGFGDVSPLEVIDESVLDSLMVMVGFDKVKLLPDGQVIKEHPGIYFDFNAVAKGYGIDLLGKYLDTQGATDYLIELGGEIVAKGMNLNRQGPWVVGIEAINSPLEDRSFQASLQISDRGMASSGNYRKYRIDEVTGKRYVHTINPLNGAAQQSDLTSATVLAPTCAQADAYATAFMAMGYQRSLELLSELNGIEVYLTYQEGDEVKVFASPGLGQQLLSGFPADGQ